jgi:hypothetical protein
MAVDIGDEGHGMGHPHHQSMHRGLPRAQIEGEVELDLRRGRDLDGDRAAVDLRPRHAGIGLEGRLGPGQPISSEEGGAARTIAAHLPAGPRALT